MTLFDLYVDDSGTRKLDLKSQPRADGVDAFALGGFICKSENREIIGAQLEAVKEAHGVTDILHSTKMRGRRKEFFWMKKEPERAECFLDDLTNFFCESEIYCIACVVHRPGYIGRYANIDRERRWDNLCRSAYPILSERAAKFAQANDGRLNIFVEQTGKREDALIRSYHQQLLEVGQEFSTSNSERYKPLGSNNFQDVLFRQPRFSTKNNPLIQMADLLLYPLVKSGYDPRYRVYRELKEAGRLIDDFPGAGVGNFCTKYYCF